MAETYNDDIYSHWQSQKAQAAANMERVQDVEKYGSDGSNQFKIAAIAATIEAIQSAHPSCDICQSYEGRKRPIPAHDSDQGDL